MLQLLPPILLLSLSACNDNQTSIREAAARNEIKTVEAYQDSMLADGFDFPFGDRNGSGTYSHKGKTYEGWYIATKTAEVYSLGIHTGEDWNGVGGGNTDKGQPVYATATGKVIEAKNYGVPWGNVVLISHQFLENGHIREVQSLYAHLDQIHCKNGAVVQRGMQIGTIGDGDGAYPAHLHFEIRKSSLREYPVTYWPSSDSKDVAWVKEHYYEPSNFINAHRSLTLPLKTEYLLVAIKHEYKMYLLKNGKVDRSWDIALSQEPEGHKEKQGDNRLPEGEYRIIQKSKAPFSGAYADYFGPVWMRINYPNVFDAEAANRKGLISKTELDKIKNAQRHGKEPPKNTALGGGVGIHGWINEWSPGKHHLTWGCISMKNSDLPKFYELIPLNTKIIIIP